MSYLKNQQEGTFLWFFFVPVSAYEKLNKHNCHSSAPKASGLSKSTESQNMKNTKVHRVMSPVYFLEFCKNVNKSIMQTK